MRVLLAWLAFAAGVVFLVVDIVRLQISGLAVLGVLLLAFWLLLIGAFRRDFWVAEIPSTHPDALGSLDVREREGRL